MRFVVLILMFVMMNISIVSAQIPDPVILADSAILVEASTGRVIYEKNADIVRPPASMTKMMTCILAIENLKKDTLIPISQEVVNVDETTFAWTTNDIIRADELTLGMMLVSDNAAAVALAEAMSGDVTKFANKMNEKAKELGCTNTHFANPNGLPDDTHLSTARDMAKIAMYGMTLPDFRNIVATNTANIHWNAPPNKMVSALTTNELIGVYNGITGIKTGWTVAAGGCLAASAKRGDIELITIIMHSPDSHTRFEDASKLLDYGFNSVKFTKVLERDKIEKMAFVKNGKKATVHIKPLEDLTLPMLEGEDVNKINITYDLPNIVEAGIKKGQILGNAKLDYDGKVLADIPLVAEESVEKGFNIWSKLVGLKIDFISSFAQRYIIAHYT